MRPVALLALAVLCVCAQAAPRTQTAAAATIPPTAERAYQAMLDRFDGTAAMDIVEFMQQYWRIAANPGFNASIDHIRDRLTRAKLPVVRVEEFAGGGRGWDYTVGSLWIAGDENPVLSKERDRVSLAINSFSTPREGLAARLVDAGAGRPADFENKAVKESVVLGDGSLGALWREAVRNRGAAGVISTQIASYIRPSDPAKMDEAHKDVFQWGSVPYDEERNAFGFKASWRSANRLREALKRDPDTRVRVQIQSSFYSGPTRTLMAEIPGRTRPDERIVIAAHVQEPGANDNASGCATLYGLAAALHEAIARGAIPRPERTITFLWLDEIRGSREWLAADPARAKTVQYMFSMDMTGEDTAKTGGTFLIEKQADPSAVWPRPSDPHSEWGASRVPLESLKGSLLNDLHLASANRRARDTGWVVRTNPYEGGSDHTVFGNAGVPSLLNWHFTDRFYHTNQDTIDKVSASEMANVALAVATSAYVLAAASEDDAMAVMDLLEDAARARLALERRQGPALIAKARDRAAAQKIEEQVIAAWIKWYREAFDSVARLPASPATPALLARIERAKAELQ
ncbi:MAG TPA: M28 family peptidase [Vicinamibacterales bacterium]